MSELTVMCGRGDTQAPLLPNEYVSASVRCPTCGGLVPVEVRDVQGGISRYVGGRELRAVVAGHCEISAEN